MSKPSNDPNMMSTLRQEDTAPAAKSWKRFFLRGPWEMLATIIIALGVVMLMQPYVMWAYTYSFITTLVGTVMFIIVSHFPEEV